ncbi:MAG: FAD-binding oxidoreductase [Gammaproteobacteria bacterium]|nr:MAG: FAD-binding oxidoreductase [Gammaproteobacteria bacterium]
MNPENHTNSYYANSIKEETNYPVLDEELTTDICIVGGGFSGVSAGLHLSELGYKVVIIEANKIGWGATGRNGGEIIGGFSGDDIMQKKYDTKYTDMLWNMRWEGNDIIRKRVEKYHIDCDLKWGYLDVAIKKRHIQDLKFSYEDMQNHNYPHQISLLTGDETKNLIGTNEYIGGLLNMGNGHVHSLNLCIGEAKAAESLGTLIYEKSPVVRIEKNNKPKIYTSKGSVSANSLLLTGNAYHHFEKKMQNFIIPVNSFVIATEPLSNEIINKINPQDLAVCDPNYILEYFRLTGDKRLLFGTRLNYHGNDEDFIKTELRKKMLRIYPDLSNVKIDYGWTGKIAVTVNRIPQIGKLTSNIYYSQGYSGHGVNMTHLAGKLISEAISGTMERFDLFNSIRPVSIPGTYFLRRPLLSLGVMLYKIKDLL